MNNMKGVLDDAYAKIGGDLARFFSVSPAVMEGYLNGALVIYSRATGAIVKDDDGNEVIMAADKEEEINQVCENLNNALALRLFEGLEKWQGVNKRLRDNNEKGGK